MSPCLFNLMQNTSCEMPGWMKHKLESRLPGEISITRYADDTTLMAESEEELNSLLMKVKGESKKAGLKFNIQKVKNKASGPFTLWQIDGETMKTRRDYFGGSKITADGDCSHEIKRRLLLGRKVMTNLDSILKSKDITLLTEVCLVKAMVFPVVMYGCESWTIKKAEHWRIDAFELWCWRRLLRVPWTARKSNQSILKEISPEYSLEGLMLKLQIFWLPNAKNRFSGKDPDAGKDWRQEEKGTTEDKMVGWHHRLDGHEFEQAPRVGDGQGSLTCCTPWGRKESDTTELLYWTELYWSEVKPVFKLLCMHKLSKRNSLWRQYIMVCDREKGLNSIYNFDTDELCELFSLSTLLFLISSVEVKIAPTLWGCCEN